LAKTRKTHPKSATRVEENVNGGGGEKRRDEVKEKRR